MTPLRFALQLDRIQRLPIHRVSVLQEPYLRAKELQPIGHRNKLGSRKSARQARDERLARHQMTLIDLEWL